MPQRLKQALALIGPYPYNPYLIFLFFFAIMFARLMPVAFEVPAGTERRAASAVIFALSLVLPVFCAGLAWVYTRFRFWSDKSLILYIAEVAIAQSFIFIYFPQTAIFLREKYRYELRAPATTSLSVYIVVLFVTLLSFAIMHKAERRILNRLEAANELVEQLRVDREQLVNLDESFRRQTSQFLHDRVQSDLMVVGMNLKSISGKFSNEVNEVLEEAIAQLENSRGQDLRNLIQTLSPNFGTNGLMGSVRLMIEHYESKMFVSAQFDDNSEKLDSLYLLGTYRIIEQALLNSFMHGPAKNVLVTVSTSPKGSTEITVSDDGPGSDLIEVKSGVGSAIIDSWTGILDGSKSIETVPGHGYRLVVSFPNKS